MILSDKQITKLSNEEQMIDPFVSKSVSKGISHGLNSFGYDLRCGSEFKIFTNIKGATADPKNFSEDNFITVTGEESILINITTDGHDSVETRIHIDDHELGRYINSLLDFMDDHQAPEDIEYEFMRANNI